MRLIAEDGLYTIEFGGVQNASGPSWGTVTNVAPVLTSFDFNETTKEVTFDAVGDTSEYTRVAKGMREISFDLYIDATAGPLGMNKLGYYVRFTFKPLSSVSGSGYQYIGVLTAHKVGARSAAEQTENFTLKIPAE